MNTWVIWISFHFKKSSISWSACLKKRLFLHIYTQQFSLCVYVCHVLWAFNAISNLYISFPKVFLVTSYASPDMYIAFNNLIGLCLVTAPGVNQHFFLWFCWLHVYIHPLYEEVCSPELEWLLFNTELEFCALQDNADSATWLLHRWLLKASISVKPYLSTELWVLYKLMKHFVVWFVLS